MFSFKEGKKEKKNEIVVNEEIVNRRKKIFRWNEKEDNVEEKNK